MKKLLSILFLFVCLAARAQLNSVTISITNAPVSTSTLTINGNTFNWTNGTPIPPLAVLITNTLPGDGTNLYNVVVAYLPQLGISVVQTNATNLIFTGIGLTGSVFSTVAGSGWASVTSASITTSSATNVVVPASSVNDSPSRTAMETQLANDIAQYAVTPIPTNAMVISTYVPTNGIFYGLFFVGIVSNATAISGNVFALSNGYWLNAVLTNGQNFGNPFRSPGLGIASEQFGLSAQANTNFTIAFGDQSLAASNSAEAFGFQAEAFGANSLAIGSGPIANQQGDIAIGFQAEPDGPNAIAFGNLSTADFPYSIALGYNVNTTDPHQIMLGTSSEFVQFPGGVLHQGIDTNLVTGGTNRLGGVLLYPRFLNTSIANGGNAAVNASTNRYVKISGPTGAFSIAGIAGGLPDREVVLLNSTSQTMTISNDSGTDPTATNRIYTVVNSVSGADIAGSNAITLLYDFSLTHWVVVGAR